MNTKGFSLIEAMMTVGLLGISMLVFLNISFNMTKSNVNALSTSEMVTYLNQVRGNLQNPTQMTAAMAGNNLNNPSHFIMDPLNPTVFIANSGYHMSNNWSVSAVNFDSVVPVPNQADLYRITVSLSFIKNQQTVANRVVGDVYCLAPANTITSCVNMATLTYPAATPTPNPHPDDWAGRHYEDAHYNHRHTTNSECGGF